MYVTVIAGGISVLAFILFLYPYLIYPVVLRFLPKRPYVPSEDAPHEQIKAALVFCAYNEEDSLPEKIANLRDLKKVKPDLEILAYSDCSTDRTNDLLEEASDILTPVIGRCRTGKVEGMQKLVEKTDADVIIFTDANVMLEPASLPRLLRYFENPEIGAVAATLHCLTQDDHKQNPTEQVGGLYWRLEESIKAKESMTGSTMGADGAVFARRKQGYPMLPGHLVDDMATSISVLFDGLRCVSAPDVHAYEHLVADTGDEFRRKRRIACGSINTYWYLKPDLQRMSLLDRFKFMSHKLIRWWGGAELLVAIVAFWVAAGSMGYLWESVSLVLGGLALIWVLGSRGLPVFGSLLEILSAIFGTWIGVLESRVGRTYQTWTPAKSR